MKWLEEEQATVSLISGKPAQKFTSHDQRG